MVEAANAYLDVLATSGTPAFVVPPLAGDMVRIEKRVARRRRSLSSFLAESIFALG